MQKIEDIKHLANVKHERVVFDSSFDYNADALSLKLLRCLQLKIV